MRYLLTPMPYALCPNPQMNIIITTLDETMPVQQLAPDAIGDWELRREVRGTEGGEAGEEGMLEFMSEGRGILCVHVCTCVYMCVHVCVMLPGVCYVARSVVVVV